MSGEVGATQQFRGNRLVLVGSTTSFLSLGCFGFSVERNLDLCAEVDNCVSSSPQMRWLKANLAATSDKRCTLAYFHHPRFSSGEEHGSIEEVKPLWDVLYAAGVDVVLSGHEHNYERFAEQDPKGRADPKRGIRVFVVGTGGESHYPIFEPIANSEVHNDHTYGVLKLTLHPKGYEWRFVPAGSGTFTDSGSARCH